MAKLDIGMIIGIPCEVMPGPFSEERLISFETIHGPISGFVRESELREVEGAWSVRGVVQKILTDTVEVMVTGSFFTTNGLASLSLDAAIAA